MSRNRLSVLFCVWGGWNNDESPYGRGFVSGDRIASRTVAEGLARKGHDVHFFSLANKSCDFHVSGVKVHFRENPLRKPIRGTRNTFYLLKQYMSVYEMKLKAVAQSRSFDMILARTVFPNACAAFSVAEKLGIPFVPTIAERDFLGFFERTEFPPKIPECFSGIRAAANVQHTYQFAGQRQACREIRSWIQRIFSQSAAVFLLSKHLATDVKTIAKQTAPLVIVPDGVDLGLFSTRGRRQRSKEHGPVIACVARVGPYKRQELLIDAMRILKSQFPRLCLWIVGEGPYLGRLKELAARNRVDLNVRFWGLQSRASVAKILSRSDVVACPTDAEGLPLSLLEGMAAGKPVVASNVEPFHEFIKNGQTGYLVKNTAASFARACARILRNRRLARKMGCSAKRFAKKFSWKRTVTETEAALYRALKGKESS